MFGKVVKVPSEAKVQSREAQFYIQGISQRLYDYMSHEEQFCKNEKSTPPTCATEEEGTSNIK